MANVTDSNSETISRYLIDRGSHFDKVCDKIFFQK